jgi:hypothetical protein
MCESKPASTLLPSPVFHPEDLIGHSFLMDKQADGWQERGKIMQLIEDHEWLVEENTTRIKFRVSVNNNQAERIITYNKMLEYITKDAETDIVWKFRSIVSQQRTIQRVSVWPPYGVGEWGYHKSTTPWNHSS